MKMIYVLTGLFWLVLLVMLVVLSVIFPESLDAEKFNIEGLQNFFYYTSLALCVLGSLVSITLIEHFGSKTE